MTDEVPYSNFERVGALNAKLCRLEVQLDVPVMWSRSIRERVDRLIKLAQHCRIDPRDYRTLMWMHKNLPSHL
jgi:hypothetical protein